MSYKNALRATVRWLNLLSQIRKDLPYHARYTGAPFPARLLRIAEQSHLLATSAITAEDYYRLGLYRREMSTDEKMAFIGKFANYRYYDFINPPQYDILGLDKVLMHRLAATLSIRMPEVLATTGPLDAPGYGRMLDTPEKAREFLALPESEDLFLKPVTGSLGADALSLGARVPGNDAWVSLPSKAVISIDDVLRWISTPSGKLGRFLIQRRVRPHPEMHAIVPNVLTTIRFGTLTRNGVPSIISCSLRFGSGNLPTDASAEPYSLSAAIDLNTGTLGKAVELVAGCPQVRQDHPITRKQVSGLVIPDWHVYMASALEAARKVAFIPWLAWDVGVTADGPVITEFNTRARWTGTQRTEDKGLLSGEIGAALLPHRGMGRCGLLFPARVVKRSAP